MQSFQKTTNYQLHKMTHDNVDLCGSTVDDMVAMMLCLNKVEMVCSMYHTSEMDTKLDANYKTSAEELERGAKETRQDAKRTNTKNSAKGLLDGAKETRQDAKEPAIRIVPMELCVVPRRPGKKQKNQ